MTEVGILLYLPFVFIFSILIYSFSFYLRNFDFICLLFVLFYLRGKQRQTALFLRCPIQTRMGPSWSSLPGTPFRSVTWGTRTRALEPSHAAPAGVCQQEGRTGSAAWAWTDSLLHGSWTCAPTSELHLPHLFHHFISTTCLLNIKFFKYSF